MYAAGRGRTREEGEGTRDGREEERGWENVLLYQVMRGCLQCGSAGRGRKGKEKGRRKGRKEEGFRREREVFCCEL